MYHVHPSCISLLHIYPAYLFCISILHIYPAYLFCISILHIYPAYLSCIATLHVYPDCVQLHFSQVFHYLYICSAASNLFACLPSDLMTSSIEFSHGVVIYSYHLFCQLSVSGHILSPFTNFHRPPPPPPPYSPGILC